MVLARLLRLALAAAAARAAGGTVTAASLYPDGAAVSTVVSSNAALDGPTGMAVSDATPGVLYIVSCNKNVLVAMNMTSYATAVFAGSTSYGNGYTDGVGTSARFFNPSGVTNTNGSTLYLSDSFNTNIRAVTVSGAAVTTLAGDRSSCSYANGVGSNAKFCSPAGIALSPDLRTLYVVDGSAPGGTQNNVIRQIDIATRTVTTVAGNYPTAGYVDGTGTNALLRTMGPISGINYGYWVCLCSDVARAMHYFLDRNEVVRSFDPATANIASSPAGIPPHPTSAPTASVWAPTLTSTRLERRQLPAAQRPRPAPSSSSMPSMRCESSTSPVVLSRFWLACRRHRAAQMAPGRRQNSTRRPARTMMR